MRTICFLIPSLDYSGAAKQLCLLAPALPRDQFQTGVCALGRSGPWKDDLCRGGVPVESLGWDQLFDLRVFWHLRSLLYSHQPDVVHAWGLTALRMVFPALRRGSSQLIVSTPFPVRERDSRPSWFDIRLLRRAYRVVVAGPTEAERCRRLGLSAEQIVPIPPAVAPAPALPAADGRRSLGLPENARLLLGVGPLERRRGFRDAVWVLDILRFVHEDVHLLLIGDGSDRQRVERFTRTAEVGDRVHFLGPCPDAAALLAQADIVWLPSHADCGVNVALEAMAAGKPVVAYRRPALAEVIVDGETGFLVPPRDQAAFARRTHLLLEDAELCRRFGEAGRRRVAKHYSVSQVVERYVRLYSTKN